jgi:23S rRNA pseudouridine2605 synthase
MLERLQKIIARAGISSRRHAEQLILSGQVCVNGQVITELGSKADPDHDRIEAAGKLVEANERRVYIVLNKPPEVVSTMADPEGRKTLRNCLKGLPERVYPVGRLDYDAAGLVFLTNDGDLAAEMLKDWSNLQQIYHVKIKGRLLMDDLERLGRNSASTIRIVRQPDATRGHAENFWYEVTLQDSKKDILRRVLFAEKHPVEKLKRIGLGSLTLEGLPPGRYRLLIDKEVAELRRVLKIKPQPRASFTPAEALPQISKPFVHPRPPRHGSVAPVFANRAGNRKHGPRPSRPPSPNRLEAEDREELERESSRPAAPAHFSRPGKWNQNRPAHRPEGEVRSEFRPQGARPPRSAPGNRPGKWNFNCGPNRFGDQNKSAGPHRFGDRSKSSGPNRFGDKNKAVGPAGPNRINDRSRSSGPNRFGDKNKSTGPAGPNRFNDRSRPSGPNRFGDKNKTAGPNRFGDRPNKNSGFSRPPSFSRPNGKPRTPGKPFRPNRPRPRR